MSAREWKPSAGWVLTLAGTDCPGRAAVVLVDLSLYVWRGRARLIPGLGDGSLPLEDEVGIMETRSVSDFAVRLFWDGGSGIADAESIDEEEAAVEDGASMPKKGLQYMRYE